MALPKVTYPIHEMSLEATGEKIRFRPFSSAEEKILLQCKLSDDVSFINLNFKLILEQCTFGKVNIDELAVFDVEKLFLKIRGKSAGDNVTLAYRCKTPKLDDEGKLVLTKKVVKNEMVDVPATCDTKVDIDFDINDIKMEATEGHDKTLEMSDGIILEMDYPKLDTVFNAVDIDTNISKLISMCIKSVIDVNGDTFYLKDETEENVELWIQDLTSNPENKTKLETFFETMPKLEHTVHYQCSTCGESGDVTLKGLKDFF